MKNIRILFVLAFITLAASSVFGQGKYGKDSVECMRNLSFYSEYMKQNNITEAAPLWREAFRLCPPGVKQFLYTDGQKIFKYLIEKNKNNTTLKNALIDSLLMMYNLRMEYFPKNAVGAQTNKAFDMVNYCGEKDQEVLNSLEQTIMKAGNTTEPAILVLTMQRAVKMYACKTYSAEKVMSTYSAITPIVENQINASHPDAAQAKKDIDLLFANSGVASCENIVELFTPKFKENPTDKELISRIVTLLSDAQCFKEELFVSSVEALHKLDPTYKSAFYLYRLYSSRDENQDAMKLLQEAIDSPQSNDIEDADMLMQMATYYFKKMNNPGKAAEAARLAVQKNPAVAGVSNLILGTIWANQKCGGNEIESRAKFWVAVDYLIRAKNADASLSEEADKLIASYRQYFPLQEEAFMYDIIDGASYTVNCGGMTATTTVRTRK